MIKKILKVSLLFLSIGLIQLAVTSCIHYRCVDGKVYKSDRGGDELWHEQKGETCTNLPLDSSHN